MPSVPQIKKLLLCLGNLHFFLHCFQSSRKVIGNFVQHKTVLKVRVQIGAIMITL